MAEQTHLEAERLEEARRLEKARRLETAQAEGLAIERARLEAEAAARLQEEARRLEKARADAEAAEAEQTPLREEIGRLEKVWTSQIVYVVCIFLERCFPTRSQ